MRPPGRWRVFACATLAGCAAPDTSSLSTRYAGRHVTVLTSPANWICAASLASADEFVERTAAFLHVGVPDVRYELVAQGDDVGCGNSSGVGADVDGCAFQYDRRIRARNWVLEHELVHILARDLGYPPAFLTEGLAVALDHDAALRYRAPATISDAPLESALDQFSWDATPATLRVRLYLAAGSFVRYAIARFGIDVVRAIYASTPSYADAITVRSVFANATGTSLNDALAEWRAHPEASLRNPPQYGASSCDGSPLSFGSDRAIHTGVAGPSCDPSLPLAQFYVTSSNEPYVDSQTFTTTDDALFALRLSSPGSVSAEIRTCPALTSVGSATTTMSLRAMTMLTSLAPGTYRLDASASFVRGVDAILGAVDLHPVGSEGAACNAAPRVALDAPPSVIVFRGDRSRWALRDVAPDGTSAPAMWLRVDVGDTTPINVLGAIFGSSDVTVRICEGSCAAATNCQTVVRNGTTTGTFQPSGPGTLLIELLAFEPRPEVIVSAGFSL